MSTGARKMSQTLKELRRSISKDESALSNNHIQKAPAILVEGAVGESVNLECNNEQKSFALEECKS